MYYILSRYSFGLRFNKEKTASLKVFGDLIFGDSEIVKRFLKSYEADNKIIFLNSQYPIVSNLKKMIEFLLNIF